MGSELRAYTKLNKIFNDYALEGSIKQIIKYSKGVSDDDAQTLTDDLFSVPEFTDDIDAFEFRVEKSFFTDGVVVLKDALAFIPEVGAVIDIGIDVVTKFVPQAFFIFQDGNAVREAMKIANNPSDAVAKQIVQSTYLNGAASIVNKHKALLDQQHSLLRSQQASQTGGITRRRRRHRVYKIKNAKKTRQNRKKRRSRVNKK